MNKIAYLVSDLHAPSHTFVRREIAALERRGLSVAALSVRGRTSPLGSLTILGHPWHVYLARLLTELFRSPRRLLSTWLLSLRHRPDGLKHLLWSQFHFVEAVYVVRELRTRKCQHLHNHFANSGATVGLLAARQAGIPWSLTLHGISETDYPAIATLPDKLRTADFVACASRFMKAQGMRLVDQSHWEKFVVVRCGIERDRLLALSSSSSRDDDTFRLLCVGRLSPEKGYFGLVDALGGLPDDLPPIELTIVGDGPSREQLERAIAEAELPFSISLLGSLPEAETLEQIAQCDALVLPSLMEGLPVVLVEARALGKPVIATALAGIPELVTHDVDGLLFEPTNWGQLGQAIATLARDKEKRQRMAREAAASFPAEFDIDRAAKVLADRFGQQTQRGDQS